MRGLVLSTASIAGSVTRRTRLTTFAVTATILTAAALLALQLSGTGTLQGPVFGAALLVFGGGVLFAFTRAGGVVVTGFIASVTTMIWLALAMYLSAETKSVPQLIVLLVAAAMMVGIIVHLPARFTRRLSPWVIGLGIAFGLLAAAWFVGSPIRPDEKTTCETSLRQRIFPEEDAASNKSDADKKMEAALCRNLQDDLNNRSLLAAAGVLSFTVAALGFLTTRKDPADAG